MLSIPIFLASVLALVSVVYGAPTSLDDHPDVSSYGIVPISWDLPIKADDPNGATVTVTGTIQEAIVKMEASYPGWNATFQARVPPPSTDAASLISAAAAEDPESYNCKVKWDEAGQLSILWGVEYLRTLTGTAKNGPGPGNCGRVSCSWNSAIWWCNDNDQDKELQWSQIADGAAFLNRECARDSQYVKGQAFYKENWNVIVRRDSC